MPLVRRELGMPQMPLRQIARQAELAHNPVLYAFSPSVIPPPDWPANHHVTGYWFLDGPVGWQPSTELRDFLAAGPPPWASASARRMGWRGGWSLSARICENKNPGYHCDRP